MFHIWIIFIKLFLKIDLGYFSMIKMTSKMPSGLSFARVNTLAWSFISHFFPNFIYEQLTSIY